MDGTFISCFIMQLINFSSKQLFSLKMAFPSIPCYWYIALGSISIGTHARRTEGDPVSCKTEKCVCRVLLRLQISRKSYNKHWAFTDQKSWTWS